MLVLAAGRALFVQNRGRVLVNDGAAFASQAARWLALRHEQGPALLRAPVYAIPVAYCLHTRALSGDGSSVRCLPFPGVPAKSLGDA